ncbi:MAG: hypothetical protein PHH54_03325 [Candidatus Nanoarchaeia archaeon]|nr:hypothetical protein [Candidatus Nanoarchaeia archaeon]MDD5740988.1 hypothetical protein [Candidatus Nanoarchaeia archaeon]
MKSEVMNTLDGFMQKENANIIKNSNIYKNLQARLGYFENFVRNPKIPNVVELINQLILDQAKSMPSLRASISLPETYSGGLAVRGCGESRDNNIFAGYRLLMGLEVKCGPEKSNSNPVIHINDLDYNRSDRKNLTEKGVLIQAYNIPKSVAAAFLNDFTKIESPDRNKVILALAESEEKVHCYEKDSSVNFYKKQIARDGTTLEGIDENAVWVFEKVSPEIAMFGKANGYHFDSGIPPYVSLDIRIERPGLKFNLPDVYL